MSEVIGQRHIKKPSAETIKKLSADEMSCSRKGDFAELYAVTWLWDQGYEVFRNYGSDGMVDMIAWYKETNEFILVDVKTMGIDSRWPGQNVTKGRSRTPEQKEKGVRILKFDPQTRNLHFMEHKE
jgi:Holliday junction resolvase-like predicted endonuclease